MCPSCSEIFTLAVSAKRLCAGWLCDNILLQAKNPATSKASHSKTPHGWMVQHNLGLENKLSLPVDDDDVGAVIAVMCACGGKGGS